RRGTELGQLALLQMRPCGILFRTVPVLSQGGFTEKGRIVNPWPFFKDGDESAARRGHTYFLHKTYHTIRLKDRFNCSHLKFNRSAIRTDPQGAIKVPSSYQRLTGKRV